MTSETSSAPDKARAELIAPLWHTAVILLAFIGLSITSARTQSLTPVAHGRLNNYITAIVFEWVIAAFIIWGVRRRGIRVGDLVGGAWPSWKSVLRDLGLAVGFLVIANAVLGFLGYLLKASPNQAVRQIYPQGNSEIVVYLALCATAGFCEELIFRGYLQKQFSILTGSVSFGVVLQGIAFGIAHGYQGAKYILIITVFGCLFGLLTAWRRSLRPGMVAHFVQDAVFGIVSGHFMK